MVRNNARKYRGARTLANWMRSKGKIYTWAEYEAAPDAPILNRGIVQLYKSWDMAMQCVRKVDETIEADLAVKAKPAPTPPKAKKKAAPKVAEA